jgi:hypothetical protein
MKGYVYILTNPSFPGLVKIGMSMTSAFKRAEKLSKTGVPHPFDVFYYVEVENPLGVEQTLHQRLDAMRVNQKREFFKIDPHSAQRLLTVVVNERDETRREDAIQAEQERKQEKELKEYENKMSTERWAHLEKLRHQSNRWPLDRISEYAGKIAFPFFGVGIFTVGFQTTRQIGIAALLVSLPFGAIHLLFGFIDDALDNKLQTAADRIMQEKYGENWDSYRK